MELFLSGGGSGEKSLELDRMFALAVGKTKPLLYIPIASNKKKQSFAESLKWINNTFNPYGLENIELWNEEDIKKKPSYKLEKFGGIYIGGGNTFYLLNELKESGFLSKLELLIRQNIPLYGGSAGAIICGKSVLTSQDKNYVKLKSFNAMNLVSNYDLWCHYKPKMNDEIYQYINKSGTNVIALPEDCGLYVTDRNIKNVGPGSAYILNKMIHEIKPGKIVQF